MQKKIISVILTYSLLIQVPLTNTGCMSFYPTEKNDKLLNYKRYEDRILLKLKDRTELEIIPKNSFFIDKPTTFIYGTGEEYDFKNKKISYFKGIVETDKIDSTKLIKTNLTAFQIYWMKDSIRLNLEANTLFSITPDSGTDFWVVTDIDKCEFRKIYDADIEQIQIKKINWGPTSLLIILGVGLAAMVVAIFTADNWGGILND